MSLYERYVLPHLINCACGSPPILKLRSQIVPQCEGVVLEVGMGSGINLDFYDAKKVDFVWGLEPSLGMRRKAQSNLDKSNVEVKWLDLPGEQIPLEDRSVDTILLTYTLCTIPDAMRALHQMRRVLKPSGKLLFCEHGHADNPSTQAWQSRINPIWSKIAGGCQLNRKIDELISAAGFDVVAQEQFFVPKTPKFAGYTYMGEARLQS
jgi:ubiquinone/menaquinone biosynthesis C-methylase UbiE